MNSVEQNIGIKNDHEQTAHAVPPLARRSFLMCATAYLSQPVNAMANGVTHMPSVARAFMQPCRHIPRLEAFRMPQWLCNACCTNRYLCVESYRRGSPQSGTQYDSS